MKMINYDFGSDLTVDSGLVTVDSGSVTVDGSGLDMNYSISFLPRFNNEVNIKLQIRDINETVVLNTVAQSLNGLFKVNLNPFTPKADTKYELVVFNLSNLIIWSGEIMYSTKDIQNYQINNSDQNILRF